MTVTIEGQRGQITQLEKKQKKFDNVSHNFYGVAQNYKQLSLCISVFMKFETFILICISRFFVQQLAEEHAASERNAQERDAAEQRARLAETKALSLSKELEELQDKLDEELRLRKSLQSERDALMESKDDVGKNVS